MTKSAVRRILASVLCMLLIFGLLPSVHAEQEPDYEGALRAIAQGYADHAESVDLSEYNIPYDELWDLYREQRNAGAYPWYADDYTSTYYKSTNCVAVLTYKFLDPTVYDYALYEQKVAEILAATVFEGMADWQIALSIHDYLVAHAAYDESLTYYEGYDLIVGGSAVCKGYTLAYMDLLNRAGVPCRRVSSEEMDHTWNLVYIDGQWYHVDATWDDPTSNREGRVKHKYFLISDSLISDEEHNHKGWDGDIVCSDTSKDTGRFWHDINSYIVYESADKCYYRKKTGDTTYAIYSRNAKGKEKKLVSWDAGYIDIGGSKDKKYFYGNNGLSLYEGRLYYSSMRKVYSINTSGGGKKTVYTHDVESSKQYIAGSYVADGILYLTLADHDGNLTAMQLELGISGHSHSYTQTKTEATCTQQGITHYACECGVQYEADPIPAKGHSYGEGEVVSEATTQQTGLKRYTCADCGHTKTEEIPKLSVNNPAKPDGAADPDQEEEVTQEEYTARRIFLGVVVVALILLIRKRKKK